MAAEGLGSLPSIPSVLFRLPPGAPPLEPSRLPWTPQRHEFRRRGRGKGWVTGLGSFLHPAGKPRPGLAAGWHLLPGAGPPPGPPGCTAATDCSPGLLSANSPLSPRTPTRPPGRLVSRNGDGLICIRLAFSFSVWFQIRVQERSFSCRSRKHRRCYSLVHVRWRAAAYFTQ